MTDQEVKAIFEGASDFESRTLRGGEATLIFRLNLQESK